MITTIRSLIIVQSPPTGVRVFPSSATNTSRLYPLLTRAFTCCAGQCLAAKDNRRASHIQVSRDRKPNSKSPGNLERDQTLRKEVMNEVAIPGKYQLYFKPDKRAIRKAEGASASDRSRPPKKVAAVKAPFSLQDSANVAADLQQQTSAFDSKASSRARGFENVAWRALEQAYARDEFPHPYLRRDYLEITEVKLLPDRRTFQLWYRPKPHDRVSEDEIAEAMVKHTAAFKAMLMKHARPSTSSRLTFQFARMSDRHASMSDIWAQLEKEVQEQSECEAMERSEDEGLK